MEGCRPGCEQRGRARPGRCHSSLRSHFSGCSKHLSLLCTFGEEKEKFQIRTDLNKCFQQPLQRKSSDRGPRQGVCGFEDCWVVPSWGRAGPGCFPCPLSLACVCGTHPVSRALVVGTALPGVPGSVSSLCPFRVRSTRERPHPAPPPSLRASTCNPQMLRRLLLLFPTMRSPLASASSGEGGSCFRMCRLWPL